MPTPCKLLSLAHRTSRTPLRPYPNVTYVEDIFRIWSSTVMLTASMTLPWHT